MKKEHHKSTRRSISSRTDSGKDRPRIEISSGGLVFKKTRRGIYFAMLKDSFGKWTFPKGHVRRGEAYDKAAAREIFEEIGLADVKKVRRLGTIDIWFRDRFVFKGRLIHKYIHYFLFEAPSDAKLKVPKAKDHGEKIQGVAWIPLHLVKERSTYGDMKKIINTATDMFKRSGKKRRKKPRVDRKA